MGEKLKVARAADIPEGGAITVAAAGKQVALFKVAGKVTAIDNVCAHRGGPLAEGFIQGTHVTCPWHGWTYDVATGASTMNPNIKQACFAVTVEGEDVFLTT
ncbi:Rieske 2Fe-2S domain-containing protein [bacterium]|nr:Rieske 2Fe-2S domain-containing protein [bacterium]